MSTPEYKAKHFDILRSLIGRDFSNLHCVFITSAYKIANLTTSTKIKFHLTCCKSSCNT